METGMDRISELPEHIIHQIMSWLPRKQVVRTSVLSKKWYHFKKSYPVLKFKQPYRSRSPNYPKALNKFRDVVYNSLYHFSRKKLLLEGFSVYISDLNLSSDLDSWLRLALENGMKSLRLCLCGGFPQPVFYSKILTILKLSGASVDQPLSIFSSLRKLRLDSCRINVPIILRNADCPVLEDLCIESSFVSDSVHISNLYHLHTVEISLSSCNYDYYDDDDVVPVKFLISSQSIQSLTIKAEDCPWSVINIDGCNHLKFLHLRSEKISDTEFNSLLLQLPLLEELYLFFCKTLKTIKILNPRIKTVQFCLEPECNVELIEILAPSLKSFILMSQQGETKQTLKKFVRTKPCGIKVIDCCNLETLVFSSAFITEWEFHNLISKFPLLENLWIIECNNLERIKVSNPQLKRLYIVRCVKLKVVEVDSLSLCEYCYTGKEAAAVSVAEHLDSTVELWFEHEQVNSRGDFWYNRLYDILTSFVQVEDESLIAIICGMFY